MNDIMDVTSITKEKIKSYVERVERLEEEKKQIADDIKEIYAEAKALGYDPKILRKCISLRKKDSADLAEEQQLLQIYLEALGDHLELIAS